MKLPRVLVVCPVRFNFQTGGGIAISGFFRGWPSETIAQIHSDRLTEIDSSVCRNYYYLPRSWRVKADRRGENLGAGIIRSDPPIGSVIRKKYRQLLDSIRTEGFVSSSAYVFVAAAERARWQAFKIADKWFCRHPALVELARWCREFCPDVIYCRPLSSPQFYLWLPLYLSRTLGVPLVTHVMDDWLAELEGELKSIGDGENSERLSEWFKEMLRDSKANLSICEAMSAALEARYGARFCVFRHSIDPEEWIHVEKNYERREDNEFRIVYAGNILPQKELGSLKDIVKAVCGLHARGMRVRLELYGAKFLTGSHARRLINSPTVEYKGFVPRAAFPRLLADADLLVVPVNFDSDSLRFIRYSFPAKVPEYMASGTPIMVYGPKGTPAVDYASAAGWGYVVSEQNPALLEAGIRELIGSANLRARLGQKARRLAFCDHDSTGVRQRFWELMYDVAFRGSLGKSTS